jgi:hypothetical protein
MEIRLEKTKNDFVSFPTLLRQNKLVVDKKLVDYNEGNLGGSWQVFIRQ